MKQEDVIREGVRLVAKVPRGDLQGWVEAQCVLNPELSEDEILRTIDEIVLSTI